MQHKKYLKVIALFDSKSFEQLSKYPNVNTNTISKIESLLSKEVFQNIPNLMPVCVVDVVGNIVCGFGFTSVIQEYDDGGWYGSPSTLYFQVPHFHLNLFLELIIQSLNPDLSLPAFLKQKTKVVFLETEEQNINRHTYYLPLAEFEVVNDS